MSIPTTIAMVKLFSTSLILMAIPYRPLLHLHWHLVTLSISNLNSMFKSIIRLAIVLIAINSAIVMTMTMAMTKAMAIDFLKANYF